MALSLLLPLHPKTEMRPLIFLLLILKKVNFCMLSLKETLLTSCFCLLLPSGFPPPLSQEGWMSHNSNLPLLTKHVSCSVHHHCRVLSCHWETLKCADPFPPSRQWDISIACMLWLLLKGSILCLQINTCSKHQYKLWMASFSLSF